VKLGLGAEGLLAADEADFNQSTHEIELRGAVSISKLAVQNAAVSGSASGPIAASGGIRATRYEYKTESFVLSADEAESSTGSDNITLRGNVRLKLLKPLPAK
jgi:lipopolysaccharide assembly outer membrane protein LptD (OstA)